MEKKKEKKKQPVHDPVQNVAGEMTTTGTKLSKIQPL